MRVNQSAEAKIAQRGSPVPLTMADDHSVNTHRQMGALRSVHGDSLNKHSANLVDDIWWSGR